MGANSSANSESVAYLEDRVRAIVDQVDEGYGLALIGQLIERLEATTKEFEAEIGELVNRLKQNAATQEELLGRIKKKELAKGLEDALLKAGEAEITEWEKRLASLEESSD